MNIIILVLSADCGVYKELAQASQKTWASVYDKEEDVKVFYYYGYREGHPRPAEGMVIEDGHDLVCGNEEKIKTIGYKTISSFRHLLDNYEFDYIFRCCAGSYIDQGNLKAFLEDKPREGLYCGAKGYVRGITYASGSGYVLSRDLVKYVVDNESKWKHNLIDDVALGQMMEKVVTLDEGAKRIHMPNQHAERMLNEMKNGERDNEGHYHYHFVAPPAMMFKIHEFLNNG